MKKYTTLLCLLLALVMVMACFTGCAKQPAQSDPADTTEPAQTTDTTPEDSTPAEPADTRETVNIRFAQFGNNLDDLDGYANDPIKAAIEQAVGVTLEYDTGTDGFDDRMQTELFTGQRPRSVPDLGRERQNRQLGAGRPRHQPRRDRQRRSRPLSHALQDDEQRGMEGVQQALHRR